MSFMSKVHFQHTFSTECPLVISFGDNRAQLCTSRGNTVLRGITQGGSHSVLNACWQIYLFVEMGLLVYGGDGWSVFMHLPQPHVQA